MLRRLTRLMTNLMPMTTMLCTAWAMSLHSEDGQESGWPLELVVGPAGRQLQNPLILRCLVLPGAKTQATTKASVIIQLNKTAAAFNCTSKLPYNAWALVLAKYRGKNCRSKGHSL